MSLQSLFGLVKRNKTSKQKAVSTTNLRNQKRSISLSKPIPPLQTQKTETNRIRIRSVHLKKLEHSFKEDPIIQPPPQPISQRKIQQTVKDTSQLLQKDYDELTDNSSSPKKYNYVRENLPSLQKDDYFKCYRNYDRANQIVETLNLKPNLYMKMLQRAQEKNLFPKTLSLVNQNQDHQQISVKRQLLGQQKYSNILVSALEQHQPANLNLSDNRLSPTTLNKIIENNSQVISLNLTNNRVTNVNFSLSQLQTLVLCSTELTDEMIPKLLQKITPILSVLDLSYNFLTDQSLRHIGAFLIANETINELYLRWNKFTGLGGDLLFEALLDNSYLKVLDLSHNSLGHPPNKEHLKKMLMLPHPELIHLDLSNNQFSQEDCEQIALSIAGNQQIYGLHFQGNQKWYVDSEGWLIDELNKQETVPKMEDIKFFKKDDKIIHSQKKMQSQKIFELSDQRIWSVDQMNNSQQLDNCWICKGWQEVEFKYSPDSQFNTEPMYVHLDFLNFKYQFQFNYLMIFRPIEMEYYNRTFITYKMCPPNQRIRYFFSNPNIPLMKINEKQQKTPSMPEDFGIILNYENEQFFQCTVLEDLNYFDTKKTNKVFNHAYTQQVNSRPRGHFRHQIGLNMDQWTLENSIFFRNFQADTLALINECFEFDFNCSRIPKLSEDRVDVVRETLRPYYIYIFTTYRAHAACNAPQFPQINLSSLNEILSQIFKRGNMRFSDLQVLFISSASTDLLDDYKIIADKALIRFQFMEMLVRIAVDKYGKKDLDIVSSIINLFEKDGLNDCLRCYDVAQDWRDKRFWNKECDEILTQFGDPIKQIYQYLNTLSIKSQNHRTKLINHSDFMEMCNMCELTNEYISDKEIMQIYFISISTQVNELYNLFHYMMNVYEFMEGLARLAERLSPCIERNKSQFDKRLGPLDSKLILMIYILYQRLKWEIRKIYHRKGLIFRDFERRIYNDIIRRQMLIGKTKEDLEAERKKEIEMKKRKLLNKPFHSRSVDTIQRRVTLRKNDKRMVFSLHQLLGQQNDNQKKKVKKRFHFSQSRNQNEIFEPAKLLQYIHQQK